ncbi:MAG: FAD-dependent oxidoreductase [Aquabacterium sp.]|uniref:NAD(P)/FAD-dependent oxidoreductase n=1 Tax=Aquabacterium sp. TaxID=1872578 RepID=UPI0027202F21|nr:FAD-dependent oxidoreductase [Aquabacterium sp.]MDO9005010.1 FAD-dependent oxidoreductase [Aquabacterium sp.]
MKSNLVIGAGALGLATAEALLRQGDDVTVLERGLVGRESSWAGGGILSPLCLWDYPDEVNRLALRGMSQFGALAETLLQSTGIDPEYNRCGMLVLPPLDMQAAMTWCTAHGVKVQQQGDGLLLPDVAQARNPRLLQALRARVEKLGGRIVEQCEVGEVVVNAGRVGHLATTQGNFSADAYIVTAGAWSKVLLGAHALKLDIKPIRGQMLLFKFDTPPLPHIVLQGDVYLIPRRDGHLLLGSTREDAGFDKSTTDEAREMLLQRGAALLPALRDRPVVKHWAGLRPASPGNIPTIGRHPQLPNLYINSGHFRYGVTMSPAAVEVLLNTMNGTPQPFDVSPYLWR